MEPERGPARRRRTGRATRALGIGALGVAAALGAAAALVGVVAGDRPPAPRAPARASAVPVEGVGAGPAGPSPLAFRYRGELCGARGCLGTTIVALCRSPAVRALLVRIGATARPDVARATLLAIPAPGERSVSTVRRLAAIPFRPRRTWVWHGPLPAWEDWCERVAGG